MSYGTIFKCATDASLVQRVSACVAQEHDGDTTGATMTLMWEVATASDIEAAYASALAAENPDPGGDETVITDQMILSNVQAHWVDPNPPPPAPVEVEAGDHG